MGGLELAHEPVDDALVPIVATEVGVAVGALHFKHTVADFEHRHVECAATEVEHQHRFIFGALVEAVGEGSGRRFVDDAQHFEASDLPGFLRGGALRVVEVRRHGDDGLGDGVAQVGLGIALELHECARADFLRGVALAVDVVALPGLTHLRLDAAEGAVGVGDGLTLGHFADEHLAGFREGLHRGGGTPTFGVGDDDGIARLENRDDRVGSAEVDTDCLCHVPELR